MSFNLLSMFQGQNGKVSSMRVGFLITLLTVLLNWSYINYEKKEIVVMPESMVALVVGLAGAKVAQGYVGAKTGTTVTPPPNAVPNSTTPNTGSVASIP